MDSYYYKYIKYKRKYCTLKNQIILNQSAGHRRITNTNIDPLTSIDHNIHSRSVTSRDYMFHNINDPTLKYPVASLPCKTWYTAYELPRSFNFSIVSNSSPNTHTNNGNNLSYNRCLL